MIIIVDGIDRAGKTTLCRALSKVYDYRVLDFSQELIAKQRQLNHHRVVAESLFAAQYVMIKNGLLKTPIILHRFYPTREVYKKFVRNEGEVQEEIIKINPEVDLPPHNLVFCTASVEVIMKRAKRTGENLDKKFIIAVKKEFDRYIESLIVHKNVRIHYLTTDTFTSEDDYLKYAEFTKQVGMFS